MVLAALNLWSCQLAYTWVHPMWALARGDGSDRSRKRSSPPSTLRDLDASRYELGETEKFFRWRGLQCKSLKPGRLYVAICRHS